MTSHKHYLSADSRVLAVFSKLTKDCDQEKMDKILEKVQQLQQEGKSVQRAMADALETFKLAGPVNA